jgi:NAD(P)-dependent dehydrogenase (short-subunit alcohol dehydrogenase family)
MHASFKSDQIIAPPPPALCPLQTDDGIEQTLAIDYFAHALLTLGLLPLLRSTPNARVLFTTSIAEMYGKVCGEQ